MSFAKMDDVTLCFLAFSVVVEYIAEKISAARAAKCVFMGG